MARTIDVLSGGLETSVQDYPGRRIGMGIPRSGPMDSLAFRIANILVGNEPGTEALEVTLVGCRLFFHISAVVAVTGAPVRVTVNGQGVEMWQSVVIPAGAKVVVDTIKNAGFRAYIAVRGGFPEIPLYLGSKSTSTGLGGYQVRRNAILNLFRRSIHCAGACSSRRRSACSWYLHVKPKRTTAHSALRVDSGISDRLDNILPRRSALR